MLSLAANLTGMLLAACVGAVLLTGVTILRRRN